MIIWDTETTGLVGPKALPLSRQPQIIEFAAIKLDNVTLEEVDRLTFLAHPGKPLPDEIVKITGITDAILKGQPAFKENFPRLKKFYEGERIHIAHNLPFDRDILGFELARLEVDPATVLPEHGICTVEQTMHIKGFRLNMTKLHMHCMGREFSGAHRAMVDVEALTSCVIWLIKNGDLKLPA